MSKPCPPKAAAGSAAGCGGSGLTGALRLAGLPETPLRFLPFFACCCFFLPPPAPGIPGMPGIPDGICPLASADIILRASKNRSTSWLTSDTSVPEPLAIRARREPFRIFGSSRSAGVIDRMIASSRSTSRSSMLAI